jgi:hypothetical protein
MIIPASLSLVLSLHARTSVFTDYRLELDVKYIVTTNTKHWNMKDIILLVLFSALFLPWWVIFYPVLTDD